MGPSEEPRFTGSAGQSRRRATTVWCGGCGVRFGAEWWLSLDGETHPEHLSAFLAGGFGALNRLACPQCGWSHVAEEPLVVHLPALARFFLVLPAALRHRAESARADLIAAVAGGPGTVLPNYAREPEMVVNAEGLAAALGESVPEDEAATTGQSPADSTPRVRLTDFDDDAASRDATRVRRAPTPPPPEAELALRPRPPTLRPAVPHDEPSLVDVDFAAAGMTPVGGAGASSAGTPAASTAQPATPAPASPAPASPAPASPALASPAPASPAPASPASTGGRGSHPAQGGPVAPGTAGATPSPSSAQTRVASRPVADAGEDDPWADLDPPTGDRPAAVRPVATASALRRTGDGLAVGGDLLSKVLAADVPVDSEDSPEPSSPSGYTDLDSAWAVPADEARSDEEATHVVSLESLAGSRSQPAFDPGRAGDADAYLALTPHGVRAAIRLDRTRHAAFEVDLSTTLRFQLHQVAPGPVPALLLVREADGEAVDTALWVLDPGEPEHAEALELLARRFSVEVQFFGGGGEALGRRVFRAPLEENVAFAIKAIAEAEAADFSAACAVVAGAEHEVVGRLRHNFTEDSFSTCANAADARLALGILAYWSAPERLEYLLRIRSFPEIWFSQMTRRVLAAALHHGLFMEPHLRQRALELGVAPHAAELLQTALSNFALVTLNLRPSGLDPLDTWENWEQLLNLAEELDLRVGEDLERVAAQAMERARQAAQDGEAIDIDADASVEVEEITDLLLPDEHTLLARLKDPNTRVEAALTLLSRGEAVHVAPVFAAMKVMSRDALERVVPATLARGPAFEAHYIAGLRSRRTSLRLASALALGEIRSERAARPLLEWVRRGPETEWKLVARAAARIGRRILAPALAVATAEDDPEGRLAHTLALLGTEARGALAAARGPQLSAATAACLDQALEHLGRVGFGDAADFAERLSDAFAHAGPDRVGPDYQEDLMASLELGPSVSGHGETDVDLDDIDPDGRSRG